MLVLDLMPATHSKHIQERGEAWNILNANRVVGNHFEEHMNV